MQMKFALAKFLAVISFILLITTTWTLSEVQKAEKNSTASFRIIGYFLGNRGDVAKYDYSKLTHIIYCFAQLNGNTIALEDSFQQKTLQLLVAQKKKYPQLKVMIALGGWTGCKTCQAVFSNEEDRIIFAKSVRKFLERYQLDGFDLDWESPVIGGKYGGGKPEDKEHFTAVIRALRTSLGAKYELSFDANSFREYVLQSVDWEQVVPQVDFINLMTYGLPNDKRGHTGHHTALYSSPFQQESVDSGVRLLDSLKVPLQKIIIGAGFYGFLVKEVDSIHHGLGRPGKTAGDVPYKEIAKRYTPANGYIEYTDSIAQASYLYNTAERTFITYDSPTAVRLKTAYAIQHKLGGIMYWKINHDDGRMMDEIHRAATKIN